MSEKNANTSTQHILWIDLEMTGLDPEKDRILEVAAVVTDWDFNEIAMFESGVGQDNREITRLMDASPFYVKMKENKRALLELSSQSPPEKVVERLFVDFVEAHCDTHYPILLAGNSIRMDRQFIQKYWPRLEQLLHYRMLDVTSWKLVFEGKFGQKKFEKSETHRALDDVRESITELEQYLSHVRIKR